MWKDATTGRGKSDRMGGLMCERQYGKDLLNNQEEYDYQEEDL